MIKVLSNNNLMHSQKWLFTTPNYDGVKENGKVRVNFPAVPDSARIQLKWMSLNKSAFYELVKSKIC